MSKPIVVVELSHSAVKVLIGYELSNQPIVLYASKTPLRGAISEGHIVNAPLLVGAVKKALDEAAQRTKLPIKEIVLALPSNGQQIFQANRSSTVVSPAARVEQIDVKNVINIIRRDAQLEGTTIVGIIPDLYALEDGKRFIEPPIGYTSPTLTIQAKIHLLPTKLCDEYANVIEEAGYQLVKAFLDTYAVSELFKSYPNVPNKYILADLGAQKSSLSLIANDSLFGTIILNKGGDDLISHIQKTFNLDAKLAEELIIKYGYDARVLNYQTKIADGVSSTNIKQPIYVDTLGEAITSWLSEYISLFHVGLKQLIAEQGGNEALGDYPLVIIGGLADLNGFTTYFYEHETKENVSFITPTSFGARNGTYAVTLGLIKAYTRYKNEIGDEHVKVTNISRNNEPRI